MYLYPCSRSNLLAYFPKNATACELGVALGEFSEHIMQLTTPRKLHLIDPWRHQDDADYQRDPINGPDEKQEARYASVVQLFASAITAGTIEVHRDLSTNVVSRFPDGYFDWIYVDARHSYDGVLADLTAYAPKVKEDGLIFGDDFSNHLPAQNMGFGVIEAVLDFCAREGFTLFAITVEEHPNYILVRDPNAALIRNLHALVQFYHPCLVSVSNLTKASDLSMTLFRIAAGNETREGIEIKINM